VAFPPKAIRLLNEVKGKVHPRTVHEGPEYDWVYSCTLSLTSALMGVVGQRHARSGLVRKISPPPFLDPRTAILLIRNFTSRLYGKLQV
jgi:hypothetical protein